jgi:hypothetical protein
MAIIIKSVPVLKNKAAVKFNSNAQLAAAKKSTIKFTKALAVTQNILAKAKI